MIGPTPASQGSKEESERPSLKNPATPAENEGGGAPVLRSPKSLERRLPAKLTRYIIFGVFAGLLPFVLDAVEKHNGAGHFLWFALFRKGELALVSAGIGFAAVGELVGHKQRYDGKYAVLLEVVHILFAGMCLLFATIDTILYGYAHVKPDSYDGKDVTVLSIYLFWITFGLGTGCIALSEM